MATAATAETTKKNHARAKAGEKRDSKGAPVVNLAG
jgi:hypothetical protein